MILSVLFAVAIALFWSLPFVSMLSYQEQYQLFLFTADYFRERICLPGGLSCYIAEFITQFNYIPAIGATLIAVLFFLLQRLTWSTGRQLGATDSWYGLSFLPAAVLWVYQADPNVMQSLTVSLIAALAAIWGLLAAVKSGRASSACILAVIIILPPAFYWLFGTTVYIVAVAMFLLLLKQRRWPLALSSIIYTAAIVYASTYLLPYPESRLLIGLHYYRYPVGVTLMQWAVMAVALLTPFILSALPKRKSPIVGGAVTIAVLLLTVFGVKDSYNDTVHDHIEYDYLVRMEKWDDIIAKAEKKQPSTPMEVSIVNLALSQRGQLLDRMFEFYQNGEQGLFPAFARDMTSPIPTAEIFFRLGMVNDCLRYCFEAQQSIPNFQLSGRLMKRIIQCEVANGQYHVARRYLLQFRNTLFYRKWAQKTMHCIKSEKDVNSDPIYRRLRDLREKREDYLFSDREMDQMMGLLLMSNRKNRMAFEYLMACVLLRRDVPHMMEYLPLVNNIDYNRMPTAIQQIVIGEWLKSHPDARGVPCKVDAGVVRETTEFIRMYSRNRNDGMLSLPPYSSNAWHYILFGSTDK